MVFSQKQKVTHTCPELNSNDAKDEEYKEAEQKNIAQHWQSVQQQHH